MTCGTSRDVASMVVSSFSSSSNDFGLSASVTWAPELSAALKALSADRTRGAENLQWALINSPEFIFNY